MIRLRAVVLGAAVVAALVFAGCSTSPMSRIDANRDAYESWPIDIREAILDGRVVNDMTPEQVEMAVGKPAAKTSRSGRQGTEDIWIYRSGGGPNLGGLTIGGGIGPVGVSQRGGGGGSEEYEVVFVNGRVVRNTLPQ